MYIPAPEYSVSKLQPRSSLKYRDSRQKRRTSFSVTKSLGIGIKMLTMKKSHQEQLWHNKKDLNMVSFEF